MHLSDYLGFRRLIYVDAKPVDQLRDTFDPTGCRVGGGLDAVLRLEVCHVNPL